MSHAVALASPSFHRFQPCAVAVTCIQWRRSRSTEYIITIEHMTYDRAQPSDLAAFHFVQIGPLVYIFKGYVF
jgi:hypothetical protein